MVFEYIREQPMNFPRKNKPTRSPTLGCKVALVTLEQSKMILAHKLVKIGPQILQI